MVQSHGVRNEICLGGIAKLDWTLLSPIVCIEDTRLCVDIGKEAGNTRCDIVNFGEIRSNA
jgi:hypothetical protein